MIDTQRTDGTEGIYYTTQSTIHQLQNVSLSDGFYVIINSMIVESCVVVITRYAKQHFTRLHCDNPSSLVIVPTSIKFMAFIFVPALAISKIF